MPLKLKNRDALPKNDSETVHILGLDVPTEGDLPFGGQVELIDLQNRFDAHEFGQFEYLLRVFCVFTRRMSKNDRVRYDQLAEAHLEPEEMAELVTGTLKLLEARRADAGEDAGNALTIPMESSTPSA